MHVPIVREYGALKKNQTLNIPQIIGEGLAAFNEVPQN